MAWLLVSEGLGERVDPAPGAVCQGRARMSKSGKAWQDKKWRLVFSLMRFLRERTLFFR